jgi:lipid A ethanolaminephosphotransferase
MCENTCCNQEIIKGDINCRDDGCFDAAVLNNLQKKIENLPKLGKAKGTVVLVHQMGSHGPAYYKRSSSDRKTYFPECDSSALQTCSRDQVVNAYDNSIRETDYFISNAIDWIKETYPDRPTAMMYVSDHGESFGKIIYTSMVYLIVWHPMLRNGFLGSLGSLNHLSAKNSTKMDVLLY